MSEPVAWRECDFIAAGDGSYCTPWYYRTDKPISRGAYHIIEPLYGAAPELHAPVSSDPAPDVTSHFPAGSAQGISGSEQ